jgi:hypothetical protein
MDTTTVTSVRSGRRRTARIFAEMSAAVRSRDSRQGARDADTSRMIWPVAALAVFLLGFVIAYGSVLQARVAGGTFGAPEDSGVETDIA